MKRLLLSVGVILMLISASVRSSVFKEDDMLTNPSLTRGLFIYNFTKHIEWPVRSLPENQFRIAVIGTAEFAVQLEKIFAGRDIFGRPVIVECLNQNQSPDGYQIVYVSSGAESYLWQWRGQVKASSLLWITETNTNARQYSGINLFTSGGRMRFQINEEMLKVEKLKVSSQLLELAISE